MKEEERKKRAELGLVSYPSLEVLSRSFAAGLRLSTQFEFCDLVFIYAVVGWGNVKEKKNRKLEKSGTPGGMDVTRTAK